MLSKIPPVPLVLSGYCLHLPSIHPGSPLRNAFNNTVSHVSLKMGCQEWLVWFAISYFAILWGRIQALSLLLSWQEESATATPKLKKTNQLTTNYWNRKEKQTYPLGYGRYPSKSLHHCRGEGLGFVVPSSLWVMSGNWERWFPGSITGNGAFWPLCYAHPALSARLKKLTRSVFSFMPLNFHSPFTSHGCNCFVI